jgi:hypothetical protein
MATKYGYNYFNIFERHTLPVVCPIIPFNYLQLQNNYFNIFKRHTLRVVCPIIPFNFLQLQNMTNDLINYVLSRGHDKDEVYRNVVTSWLFCSASMLTYILLSLVKMLHPPWKFLVIWWTLLKSSWSSDGPCWKSSRDNKSPQRYESEEQCIIRIQVISRC